MFVWKINLIDGKSFNVESEISNTVEFLKMLTGQGDGRQAPTRCIQMFRLDRKQSHKLNSVAIMSDQVTSVEYNCEYKD